MRYISFLVFQKKKKKNDHRFYLVKPFRFGREDQSRSPRAFLSLATVRVFNKKYEEERERERVDISRGQRADKSTCASARGLWVIRE